MERKYYLRGLGIGIAVTAIIMGFSLSSDKTMTNDEIIARAKELGMVENTVLSDTGSEDAVPEDTDDNQADSQDIDARPQNDTENVQDDTGSVQDDPEKDDVIAADDENDTETDIDASEQEEQAEGDDDEQTDPVDLLTADDSEIGDDSDTEAEDDDRESAGGTVTAATVKMITINSGDSSYTVAKKLADVGVVTSAATFDTFLCQNGYDKSLRTGTFSIPADASDEQIARIVTGRE